MTGSRSVPASSARLAAFASAIILAIVALLIGYEFVMRVIHPVMIEYREAISIAVLALCVNLASAYLLHDRDHHHRHGFDENSHDDDDHGEPPHRGPSIITIIITIIITTITATIRI